jgi:hypothetical protein
LPKEPLVKLFLCHPERSEGSQPSENTRFFAPLRMTMVVKKEFCKSLKGFFRFGKPYNPPCPPLKKGGNCKKLLLKSPFEKGGFDNLQTEGIYGKR